MQAIVMTETGSPDVLELIDAPEPIVTPGPGEVLLDLTMRIGGIYPLPEAAQAHRDMESRATTGKLLLIP